MRDLSLELIYTGNPSPLSNWNEVADFLALNRARLTKSMCDEIQRLREQTPEYQAWLVERLALESAWCGLHGATPDR